jgi:hypothetical protein
VDVLGPRGPDASSTKLADIALANVSGKAEHKFTVVRGPGDYDPEHDFNVFEDLNYVSTLMEIYDGFSVHVGQGVEWPK